MKDNLLIFGGRVIGYEFKQGCTTVSGCDWKSRSVFGSAGVPEVVGASDAEVEHGLGVGFLPPSARQFEALLDDVAMAAFDLS